MKRHTTTAQALLLCAVAAAQPSGLTVNHLYNSLGVDDPSPRLEWRNTGTSQIAYRITVNTDSAATAAGNGTVWDSGIIASTYQYAEYNGAALRPSTIYYWRVEVYDEEGHRAASEVSHFETGLMGRWHGSWISDGKSRDHKAAPYFRKTFSTRGHVTKARAYIAAAGLFRLSVNGSPATDDMLSPAFTRYDRRIMYNTIDVTSLIADGRNAVGVVLGNGWYNHQARAVWDFDNAPWRDRPAFCMDLLITYDDGTEETISTDLSWRTSEGGLVYNNIYTGEHYDFTTVQAGWDTSSFDDASWGGARLRACPAGIVTSQQMSPIRATEELSTTAFRQINDSVFVYDFGRNMSGVTRVSVKGTRGTRLTVRHGERLSPDGRLDQSNIDVYYRGDRVSEPFQTDILTLSGGYDTFAAAFSYKGFRYAEVTVSGEATLHRESITALFVHSDVNAAGSIISSNETLNKVVAAAQQAYLSNLMGYPTDCPQREKNGWTGDGHFAIETALYNYDAITVYTKWLADHRDEQQPNGVLPDIIPTGGWGYGTANGLDWTSTIAIIPWELYLFYGDLQPLRDCYDNIRRYVDYAHANSRGHLSTWGRGDWVPVHTRSEQELISSVYLFVDAVILAKAAQLIGRDNDHSYYSQLAADIRDAINNKYLDREKAIYANGSQTEMSMALMWGVVPDDLKERVAANLAAKVEQTGYHLDVGVHGAKALLNALSENGYADTAYRVAVQDTYPSWGWWIVNGHTTLLENWDLQATSDISDNHIMFGEIGAWPYKGLGGIFPDEQQPGFKHILLRPNFVEGLDKFEARHTSPYGEIISAWQRKGGKLTYTVTVPSGSTATLLLPQGVDTTKEIELSAGTHTFEIP